MYTKTRFVAGKHVLVTIWLALGWLILALCWTVFSWTRHSVVQILAGLGISTLLFVATVALTWVAEQGRTLALTVLTTLGWPTLALYWIGFEWLRHTLLLNGAVLIGSLLLSLGILVWLWLHTAAREGC